MSVIHINRIRSALHTLLDEHVDLTDAREGEDVETRFLSRALAAYAVSVVSDTDVTEVAKAITDGFDDNGLDVVYFDPYRKVLHVAQSKWIESGGGSISQGDCKKLTDGFRDLVAPKFERFNDHIKQRQAEIHDILCDSSVKCCVSIVHTGTASLSTHAERDILDLIEEMNTPDEVVRVEVFDQERVYRAVASHAQRPNIDLSITLTEWGAVDHPYRAYYGQVSIAAIREWWGLHGQNLFAPNIRDFRGDTDVNLSLAATIHLEPQNFFYFNNGITIVCQRIQKQVVGGGSRQAGVFECQGVGVVNGAQTVGIIGATGTGDEEDSGDAHVLVRLISLEDCPAEFGDSITRATNTQNRVLPRDFAALDGNQRRIASEFVLDGMEYAYRTGDREPEPARGCTITEATVALACASDDVSLTITAKREIGRLWEVEHAPYQALFKDSTTAVNIWKAVRIMRTVDSQLMTLRNSDLPRADMVAIHGNRLILHSVFMHKDVKGFRASGYSIDSQEDTIRTVTGGVFLAMADLIDTRYGGAYLASLFKNPSRCRELDGAISSGLDTLDLSKQPEQRTEVMGQLIIDL